MMSRRTFNAMAAAGVVSASTAQFGVGHDVIRGQDLSGRRR
jgi:hypothetical protein